MQFRSKFSNDLFLFGLCLFFCYTIPLHYHPYREFFNDGIVILGLLLGFCYFAISPHAKFRIPSAVVMPIGLIVVIGLQAWNRLVLFPMDSFFPIVYLICFSFAIIYGSTISSRPNGVAALSNLFALVFLATGICSVVIQHVQLFNLNFSPFVMPIEVVENIRPFANVAQPNLMALIFCFSLVSVWYMYLMGKIKPVAAVSLPIILLWGLALTQSRIGWIILPLYLILCWSQPVGRPKVSKIILILLSLLFIGMTIALPDILAWFGILVHTAGEHAGQTSARIEIWKSAWLTSELHPWFGAGWFQYGANQVILATLLPPSEYSDYAHNIILNFAAEIGWPFTLLIFISASYWFYICCIRRWGNIQHRFMSMMLIAIAVHSMVEFPLWYAIILIPFGVMVGAMHCEVLGCKTWTVARPVIIVFITACALFMGALTWDYYRVMTGFVALVWQQEGKKEGIGSTVKPDFTFYPQFYDYFAVAKIKIFPGMPKDDIQFLERTSIRFAFTPILQRVAMAYAYNQRATEALQVIITVQHLHADEYPQVYKNWESFAKKDPRFFNEIFKRMPKPETTELLSDMSLGS